jgi:ABC-type nitrate/sulfonate/bicarbonate transport system substrate-binding protein
MRKLILLAGLLVSAHARAADSLMVFVTPSVAIDSLWTADAKGLFKAANLDVQIRVFPSGTTATQTFQTGTGDIMLTGDLPGLQYWQRTGAYKIIAPIERDSKGYAVIATNKIKTAADLAGKTVATRVGSTGSWFVSEYLTKNNVPEASVTVKNLDPPLMPPAICRGDIDAFFVWEPTPSKAVQICGDQVHYLSTGEGYIEGYNIAGARSDMLATAEGADKVKRFLVALRQGAELAANDLPFELAYLKQKFGFTDEEITSERGLMERVLKFDAKFFSDFCSENQWQEHAGLQKEPSDLSKWIWPDGLRSIDPALVTPAPPPC